MADKNPDGERLRIARERAGFSGESAAEILHLDRSTLNRYENGKRIPSEAQVRVMALTYSTSEEYLYDETDDPSPKEMVIRLDEPSEMEKKLLAYYRCLNENDQNAVYAIVERIATLSSRTVT